MPDDVKTVSRAAAETGPRVLGLDHVVLRVADMNRSIEFYGKVLGCQVERRLESIGLVQLRAGASMIDLVPLPAGEAPGRNMDHYAVRIADDPATLAAHLEKNGVAVGPVQRRYGAEGYGSSIYITDPDGNTVELKGPPEAA